MTLQRVKGLPVMNECCVLESLVLTHGEAMLQDVPLHGLHTLIFFYSAVTRVPDRAYTFCFAFLTLKLYNHVIFSRSLSN